MIYILAAIMACKSFLYCEQNSVSKVSLPHAQAILEKYVQDSQNNLISIEQLSGGFSTASNFLVNISGKQYVLRIYKKDRSFCDVQKEFYALIEAAKKGLSPAIYEVFWDDYAILMDYLPGNTITPQEAKKIHHSKMIAKALHKVHTIENPYTRTQSIEKIEELYQKLHQQCIHQDLLNEAICLIRQAQKEVVDRKRVNLHGDLNPRNIFITDAGVRFIDWSDTSKEDPFFDVSYFSLFSDYTPEQEEFFLTEYLEQELTAEEWHQFFIIKRINLAKLCLQGLSVMTRMLQKDPRLTIDVSTPLKDWSYYVSSFAIHKDLSAQFFYEFAKAALAYAKKIPERNVCLQN